MRCGKVHDYLGIHHLSEDGKVIMTMNNYIAEMFKEVPDDLLKGTASRPASNYLFNVNPSCKKIDNESAVMYHHLTAKLLYLAKQV